MSMPSVLPPPAHAREAVPLPGAAPAPSVESSAITPCWPSEVLLGDGIEAHIRHGDALYRLRLTRQGKLILTK
ncbi:hemin uptake protein HemP [Ideonella sp. DXS22W]|uniref:Hemin uptake protein HemP n=1 Tax=Pseudaquabacterium inlustre TaxID=2984192 RepID=A0ABU9CHN8_9BURK